MNQEKGIWIPIEILQLEGIGMTEKVILAKIAALCGEDGCWANNQYFATLFSMHRISVSKHISNLEKAGLIACNSNQADGNKRVITLLAKPLIGISEIANTLLAKPLIPISENANTPISEIAKHNKETIIKNELRTEEVSASATPKPPEPKPVKPQNIMPPTFEMFVAHWIEKGYPGGKAGAQICFDHYDMKGWKSGTTKLSNWHAVARNASTWDRIVNLKNQNNLWNQGRKLN